MTLVAFDESALPDADTLVALYDLDNGKRKHAELKYTCEQVYAKYWRPSVSVARTMSGMFFVLAMKVRAFRSWMKFCTEDLMIQLFDFCEW